MDRTALTATLTQAEGRRPYAYDDHTGATLQPGVTIRGNPTVGVGRNLLGTGLSAEEIGLLLDNDIDRAVAVIRSTFGGQAFQNWTDARQRALVEMAFNLGGAKFSGFHNMIAAVKGNAWTAAAREALLSDWARELPARSARIASILNTGE